MSKEILATLIIARLILNVQRATIGETLLDLLVEFLLKQVIHTVGVVVL